MADERSSTLHQRRTNTRQAAFSFLSTIKLNPATSPNAAPSTPRDLASTPRTPLLSPAQGTRVQESEAALLDSAKPMTPISTGLANDSPLTARTLGRGYSGRQHSAFLKKEEAATAFLSGIRLQGTNSEGPGAGHSGSYSHDGPGYFGSVPRERQVLSAPALAAHGNKDEQRQQHQQHQPQKLLQPSQDTESDRSPNSQALSGESGISQSGQSRSNFSPVLRRTPSSNTPNSSPAADRDHQFRAAADRNAYPHRVTSPGVGAKTRGKPHTVHSSHSSHTTHSAHRHGTFGTRKSFLSLLLSGQHNHHGSAHSSLSSHGRDSKPSDNDALVLHRRTFSKSPAQWLAPLASTSHHVLSNKANAAKKFFRRSSISFPNFIPSGSTSNRTRENRGKARKGSAPSSHSLDMFVRHADDRRHIFYTGSQMSSSFISLGEELTQHPVIFTTKQGSPFAVSSIIRYADDRAPSKRRRRKFDREYIQQITKEALIRKKANSFAYLLSQSNALSPDPHEAPSYNPYYLDDPELKTGKNRTVISLACYMGSVIQYTRPSDLKRELNEHFRNRHPTIDPTITLSKIRKVKADLLAISEELDLEISTTAMAYAYFEKLILKGSGKSKELNDLHSGSQQQSTSIVNKANRKLVAGVCLLLAYKVNEPKRMAGEFSTLMKYIQKFMEVSPKDLKEQEFQIFALLEFNLYIHRQEFLPHFEQIVYRQDYNSYEEYLGEDEFYSVHATT